MIKVFQSITKGNVFLFSIYVALLSYIPLILLEGGLQLFPSIYAEVEKVFSDISDNLDFSIVGILEVTVVVPILETVLFQVLCISTLSRIYKNVHFCSLLSGGIFGLSHPYHIVYTLATMTIGGIYGYAYFIARKERTSGYAFWGICISHALSNLVSLIVYANTP